MNIWWLHQTGFADWAALVGALFIGHAFADYAFQTDFMARAKNRHWARTFTGSTDLPPATLWLFVLSAHSAIHAGVVWILTGCGWLGLAEFFLHWLIDWARMEGKISFRVDQLAHLGCKVGYVSAMALW
jgi:Protein of unknown function (DUF3307)